MQHSLKAILQALFYSWRGLRAAVRYERAFRQELCLLVLFTPVALLLPVPWWQSSLLLGTMGYVLVVELLNSAIEAIVDLVSPNIHPLAARAKDVGSAAVFLSILLAILAWGVIAGPVLIRYWL